MKSAHVVVKERMDTLDPQDESFGYLKGEKYSRSWLSYFKPFALEKKLAVLNHLYPYQIMIKDTHESYHERKQQAILSGLLVTGASWYAACNDSGS